MTGATTGAARVKCPRCPEPPPDGAAFCPRCGTACVAAGDAAAAEERRVVTVLFCDLVGSTALSGRLDPETLRTVTLRYFALMRARIEEHGGTVEKFIGDAVMAVFGVPVRHEDDAHRALAAARGMVTGLDGLNAELEREHGVRLAVRIGVNTGEVVVSVDPAARQALVSGEVVNIGARLEQHAGAGDILIGPATLDAAGPSAVTESAGSPVPQGRRSPRPGPPPGRTPRGRPGAGTPVRHPLHRTGAGTGRTPPAVAQAGDGPALAPGDRLRRGGPRQDAPAARVAAGLPGVRRGPMPALRRVRLPVAARRSGTPGARRRRRGHGPRRAAGPERTEAEQALRLLRTRLLADGPPSPSAGATLMALACLLDALSRERPVVLVLDDCHWASGPLLDLADRLLDELDRSPVALVCVARPELLETRPGWGSGRMRSASLLLTPLTREEAAALAGELVEVAAHRQDVLEGALDRAEGNPLYLEHLTAMAAECDDLPLTVHALLGARIDALPPEERTLLQVAAVLGREFQRADLTELATAEEPETRRSPPAVCCAASCDGGSSRPVAAPGPPAPYSGSAALWCRRPRTAGWPRRYVPGAMSTPPGSSSATTRAMPPSAPIWPAPTVCSPNWASTTATPTRCGLAPPLCSPGPVRPPWRAPTCRGPTTCSPRPWTWPRPASPSPARPHAARRDEGRPR